MQLPWETAWLILRRFNIVTIRPGDFTPSYISTGNENIWPHKNLYINLPSSIIPKSPNAETNRQKDRIFPNVLRKGSIIQWLKKHEERIHTTTWISLENITLSQSSGVSSGHVSMWELDHKVSWAPKNWCFWTVVLEKTLESPLDCKGIQPVHPKGDQSWIFVGRTGAKAEAPILWPPDAKNWLIGKDPDAGKDWRQKEKGGGKGWDC